MNYEHCYFASSSNRRVRRFSSGVQRAQARSHLVLASARRRVIQRGKGVLETSVVGEADPKWGEVIVAFVVVRPDASVSKSDLDSACLRSIARFMRPKRYVFVDALPKNNYGKVLKTELRELLSASEQKSP